VLEIEKLISNSFPSYQGEIGIPSQNMS
jgi:hypothetical protein